MHNIGDAIGLWMYVIRKGHIVEASLIGGAAVLACTWAGKYVHESVAVRGVTGQLRTEIQHYAYRDIADHLETIDRYSTYAAREMREAGRRAGVFDLVAHPPLAFLRNYVVRGGARDGVPGFIISAMNSYYVFLKFAKLWELERRDR